MKLNKEIIIGITVVFIVLIMILVVSGFYGILYIGTGIIVALVSIYLFSNKALVSKSTAVIFNMDLIYKILMPKKFKNEINKLKENEKNKNT